MNKPTVVALGLFAALIFATGATYQQAAAQYGVAGSPVKGATPEQLKECESFNIPKAECTENALLAKRRVQYATETTYGNKAEGSGTAYFAGNETWVFIGVLAAIFGGVAAAFFFKGRGASPPS